MRARSGRTGARRSKLPETPREPSRSQNSQSSLSSCSQSELAIPRPPASISGTVRGERGLGEGSSGCDLSSLARNIIDPARPGPGLSNKHAGGRGQSVTSS